MAIKRVLFFVGFALLASSASAQINIYVGGNLQGNYSWLRADENSFKPGFGGGFSFVYWEYEYWFLKAGLDYVYKSSTALVYPDEYDVEITGPEDKVKIEYHEQALGVPLTIYFRPYESGENAILITGTLQLMFITHLREDSEEFGEIVRTGAEIYSRAKTNLGIGAGYQRQLDRHMYLNIYPSFNFDLRAYRPFSSITLTAELLFGVY